MSLEISAKVLADALRFLTRLVGVLGVLVVILLFVVIYLVVTR
jgi:hypothetical protein